MSADVTGAVFAAYLKCPTKAYLMAQGEKPPDSLFADLHGRISTAYKASARQTIRTGVLSDPPIDFVSLTDYPVCDRATLLVDCETASYASDGQSFGSEFSRTKTSKSNYLPILYSAFDKSDKSDNLLVCLGALAIAQVAGTEIPSIGKVIYGEEFRGKTIRVADQMQKARQLVEAITSVCYASGPPPLVLNKHCPTCDFQSRCRSLAVKGDNLSLLGAMTAKERAKCAEKGITTITQLSYGYRPRRRRTKVTTPRRSVPVKHDHKLKALAIKKAQIHIVGSPSLSSEGTPVFMDVEGMPGRDFYYLVSLRHETRGTYVERSFWADGPEGERDMWWECLRFLKTVETRVSCTTAFTKADSSST